jgi:molybdenum cofactor cytidylyltransferase
MADPPRNEGSLAAVILAAGQSRRMGSPKACLRWGIRTFLEHLTVLAEAAGAEPIVVVDGAHALAEVPPPATRVHNAGWTRGPLSSLQEGLRALPPIRHVLVLTVDRPHVSARTVQTLLETSARDPDAIVQPELSGTSGHPLLLPGWLLPGVLELAPTASLRELLRRDDVAARRRRVPVTDPAVVDNIDHPEDLARLPDP